MRLFATDPLIYLILVLGLLLVIGLGFFAQQQTLMPVLSGLIGWLFLLWALRHARPDIGLRIVGVWAATVFLLSLVAGRLLDQQALAAVPGSLDYIAAQMLWLTGQSGAVEQPGVWLAAFARRAGLLLAGSILSAGLVPLIAGARYLAVLGLWMARLFDAPRPAAILFGLAPWVWAEVVAQVVLVVVLAEPLVTGDAQALVQGGRRRLLLIGLVALVLAAVLHLVLPGLLVSPLRYFVTGDW
ncbi:MAG: hypothetical protein RMN24_12905 [Anaerolineae bacterium]|nr:hypothetical protein [Caldilineales bacterium]MCX7852650.1 hypothetical protein [Caldilineales bacterium]MDW8270054.1 hypothetical protein [Anaerolineae bacterium]